MATGYKTPGSGRKKGAPNKKPAVLRVRLAQIEADTPLERMIMRDVTLPPQIRFEAAKAAAPYIHPKAPEKRPDDHQSFRPRWAGRCSVRLPQLRPGRDEE
jgi:hypothetical protein